MGVYIGPVLGILWAASLEVPGSGQAETVTRPDPGLARGVWEAPRWLFFGLAAIAVAVTALYFLRRAGLLRLPPRGRAK